MDRRHLADLLELEVRTDVPLDLLARIQAHLHALIRERAGNLVEVHALRLPELVVLRELEEPAFWFAVPGMYGGFNCRLDTSRQGVQLVAESWSRVVGGSGQRHEITIDGAVLIDEGFV